MAVSNVKLLENLVDYCALKNKVISKNIANVGTKDYKREDVKFESIFGESLNSAIKTTNDKHFDINSISDVTDMNITMDKSPENTSGINNVDIDREMSELAENSIQFKFASKKLGDYYRNIQNVIRGGGKL